MNNNLDNVFNKIFSYDNSSVKHTIIRIFGIKISLVKRELKEIFNVSKYNSYKRIGDIPKAQGNLRKIQLTAFSLLEELDKICQEQNLVYWLDFGTLLGAVRHNGFIPWDDDIDVGMLRDDFEKLMSFFKTENHPHLVTVQESNIFSSLKLKFKNSSDVFVDIFPYDRYNYPLGKKEKNKLNKKIKNIVKRLHKEKTLINDTRTARQTYDYLREIYHTEILDQTTTDFQVKPALFWGMDYLHKWKNWVVDYENIFPLTELIFENKTFPVPAQYDYILKNVYGDYMKMPKKVLPRHNAIKYCLSTEEYNISAEEEHV